MFTCSSSLVICVVLLLVIAPLEMDAQSTTASIYGRVLDTSGASIPNVAVRAIHIPTATVYTFATDAAGSYDFPEIRPGAYRLEAEMSGFRTTVRKGIVLALNQRTKIDLTLEVGSMTERIEVIAPAPLLETSTAATGQLVASEQVDALPVAYRVPWSLVLISAGVTPGGRTDVAGRPGSVETANFSVNGSRGVSNEMIIDGITAVVPEGGSGGSGSLAITYSPAVDATQEFRIYTNSYSAEFGKSGGGVVSLTLKSGTNEFHGSLYDFLRNDKLDANEWFSNANNLGKGILRQNQWGGSIGGPIIRNRSFFFFDYQGFNRSTTAQAVRSSLPTPEMGNGDFSNLRNAQGGLITIYDPLTAGSGQPRTPFKGNIIPRERMDPVAVKIWSFVPKERRSDGDPFTHLGNNTYLVPRVSNEDQFDVKIDHRFGSRHGGFLRYSKFDLHLDYPPTLPGSTWATPNPADSGTQTRLNEARHYVVGHTWTMNRTTILDWRAGYVRYFSEYDFYNGCQPRYCEHPFKATQAGFPQYIDNFSDTAGFPSISISGYESLGTGNQQFFVPDTISLQASLTKVKGRHVIKAGFDGRRIRNIRGGGSNRNGAYSFNDTFTRRINTRSNPSAEGNAFASFLLGAAASGSISRVSISDVRSQYFAFYFQDDLKLTSKLTLNLGVRYDVSQPLWDSHDQISFINMDAPSPLGSVAGLPPLKGGLEFANQGRLEGVNNTIPIDWNNFAPRLGLAYQLSPKWVVRAGAGILYKTQIGEAVPPPKDSFSITTSMVSTLDGARPFNYLSNPFPDGILLPRRGADGLLTNVGSNASGISGRDSSKVPYIVQWNLNVQRQLPGNMMVEVGYTGNAGHQLDRRPANLNELNPIYVQQYGARLNDMVANPFYGMSQIPASSILAQPTVQRGQLLRPFPQFLNFTMWNYNGANSEYHGFTARLEKRYSNGLTLLASYAASKTMDDYSGIQDWLGAAPAGDRTYYDHRREWALNEEEVSQRLVFSYTYELPFGKGRRFMNRGGVLDAILGGWRSSGILTFSTGNPIDIVGGTAYHSFGAGAQRPNSTGVSAAKSGPAQGRLDAWFDTKAFTNPEPFTLGNLGRTLPDVRTDGTNNADIGLGKTFRISERIRLNYRAEIYNFTNTPVFGRPQRSFTALDFGKVSAVRNSTYARQIQMALRLIF